MKGRDMFARILKMVSIMSVVAVLLSGCTQSIMDKFIRKDKNKEEPTKRYYAVRDYDVKPSEELYSKRFVYWKTWHSELLDVLDGESRKKREMAVEQALSNLMDMRSMLKGQKEAELQVYVDEMMEIEKTIKEERVTGGNAVILRRRIESIQRAVNKDFAPSKVQGYIAAEFGG